MKLRTYVTGRWVLTINTDRQGNFLQANARWVLKGFQDETEGTSADRVALLPPDPGFRMSCQMAARQDWIIFHIDLKTAFLHGQSSDVSRDGVCQLPPEAGHPPCIAARLKKPAYGMSDAPRRWWRTSLTKQCVVMTWFLRALIDDVMCCVLHSRVSEPGNNKFNTLPRCCI